MAARFRLIGLLLLAAPAAAVDLFGDGEPEFLPPNEAFEVTALATGPDSLRVDFRIAEGYYLYRGKTNFLAAPGTPALQYELPGGIVKDDPLFGPVETWTGQVPVALRLASPPEPRTAVLEAHYQGCAEQGVCYPPQTKLLEVALDGAGAPPMLSRSDRIAEDLAHKALAWSFLAFIGFGLLLAFTPCVLPMIPILASVIAGAGNTGTRRAFFLSLTYVLAMAATYALLGVVIGLTGSNLQAAMQNVWVIGGFVLILVLLALTMFGVCELRLPSAWANWLARTGRNFKGGSFWGAGVMGFLGALIASPCVSPPLVGALIHIADTGSPVRGGVSLFGLGLGLGLPLLAFGAFEGRFLPKSGAWMIRIKAVFGVLLLALGIWMLDRVVPGQVTLALSGLLLLMVGVFLRALDSLPPEAGPLARLGKGAGLALLIFGGVLVVEAARDALWRTTDHEYAASSSMAEAPLPFRPIKTRADLDQELARAAGQPVLVDFYADWCVTCQEIEAFTFSDEEVQARMRRFVLLRADVTANDEADRALLASLGLFGPPAILFYAADGSEMRGLRTVSYVPAERFAAQLDDAYEFAQ